jgi:hypothetical protein
MFSEDQLEQLRSFPEVSRDELIRYFTPAAGDVAFVDPGHGRGAPDRLGMLVQLCTLPWLGFVPDDVTSAPTAAVARLADRLGVDPAALSSYGQRPLSDNGTMVGVREPNRASLTPLAVPMSLGAGHGVLVTVECCG